MRAHISLAVRDVAASAAFYGRVFGVAAQKQTAGYAKFDLGEPPLNLALVQAGADGPSRVGHLGIEADSPAVLAEWRRRLEAAGIPLRAEPGSTCCYALQDKFWFEDPDRNAWELFVVHRQLPTDEANGRAARGACCP